MGSSPTSQTLRAQQSRAEGASTKQGCHRKSMPALCYHLASSSTSCSALELLLPRHHGCLSCVQTLPGCPSARTAVIHTGPAAKIYPVTLFLYRLSGQPACPMHQFPGRPLFSKRKGRRKSKPHNDCGGENL